MCQRAPGGQVTGNSVCNHTRDLQDSHVLLITRMITDRIGLHSV